MKLGDFGLCAELQNSIGVAATFTGTCKFMAPERIQHGVYSFPADIWSFGMALFHCVTGEYPFSKARTYIEVAESIVLQPAPSLAAYAAAAAFGGEASSSSVGAPATAAASAVASSAASSSVDDTAMQEEVPEAGAASRALSSLSSSSALITPPLPRINRGPFSAELQQVLSACLSKDPSARKSAEELLPFPWFSAQGVTDLDAAALIVKQWLEELAAAGVHVGSKESAASAPAAVSAAAVAMGGAGMGGAASAAAGAAGGAGLISPSSATVTAGLAQELAHFSLSSSSTGTG